ncbi:rhomboid family intramembrane serine protease [Corynebacterium sp. 3HC-13]|uniref:rhomboid family intramembrane serine protease n=1 Tax=Corynebacterium poyangense TaxID=2684405 RepID=UPI001CCB74CD|nr:rhomboid family intramembrane serine protease [Corynebacterium poyangense]MBZ8177301.1 rhomboid family intramembrane serine protease [Corynebacterium poyangense]
MSSILTPFSKTPITHIIISLCIVVWCGAAIQSGSITEVLNSPIADSLVLWGPAVYHQPLGFLRGIGALFIHLDISHLVMNMAMLYLIGAYVEPYLGSMNFALIYGAGGLCSSAAVLFLQPLHPTVGASGAIYTLMAVLVAVNWRRGLNTTGVWVLIFINVALSFLLPNISLAGHAGGLALGILAALGLTSTHRTWLSLFPWLLVALSAVIFYLAVWTL